MRKLRVDLPVNNIKGEAMHDRCGKKDCVNCHPAPGVRKGECEEGKPLTIGDMILNLLGQNGIIDTKERDSAKFAYWIVELGIMISEAKGEIEIGEDRFQFLKKVVDTNKVKIGPDKMEDFMLPFTWGQCMMIFDEDKMAERAKADKKAKS